jgi:insulysin
MVWSAAARIIRPPTSSPVSTRRHEEPTLRHPHFIPAFFIALLLGGCAAVTSDRAAVRGPTAGAAVADSGGSQAVVAPPVTVVQSPNDDRDYRFVTLDNGLRVLLVSDPATDKAAASLVVFRGSYHDPDEYPGLAHFLEHMLFIGTEKYPAVDGYQTFISQHGGSSNAYTAGDHTNYFFDIHPGQFRAAMDRFAQFFISPLFAEDYVEREKNAVHSEYQMQLKADNWRAASVIRAIANPEHPHSRFNIGALETLGDGVRDALVEFFEAHYSADQMALVALSNEPVDEMAAWVAPMFGRIENREAGPAPVEVPLFRTEQLPAVVGYQTIKRGYRVTYNFPIPGIDPHYRQKPADYLANLLGHEGRGSLYQRLQREGWIESLAAGSGSYDQGNSVLSIDIDLTDAGYQQIDAITALLFEYIELMRRQGPEAWRFQELATMAELGFRFQEKSSATAFVYQVAPRFQKYPPEHVLAAQHLMTEFDPALIHGYLEHLTADNLLMEIAGPDVPADQRERWFDVPYRLEVGPPALAAVDPHGLALPAPNPYLPDNLAVLADDPAPPRLAVARPGLTLWSDRDTEFGTPRANLYLSLGIPDGIASAEDLAMATLYQRVVRDALTEAVYPAYLAGLGYRLDVDGYGFLLTVNGYDDKQLTLLATVLAALTDTAIDPDRFHALRDEVVREWGNYRDERPFTQAFGALGYLLLSNRWPPEMLMDAVDGRTPEDLERWRKDRAARFHVLGLHHGNVPAEGAWALASTLKEHLALGAFRREAPRIVYVADAYRYPIDIDHQDAAMVAYLQDADNAVRSRAISALTASILRQAYFTSLRTEQQLGYVVALTHQMVRDRGGLAFIVQSPVASAADLERATGVFLHEQLDAVAELDAAAFADYQQGLITRLTERDRNLGERGRRLWGDLELGMTTFDSNQQVADAVAALTLDDVHAYLTDAVRRFDAERLLVYSTGRFDGAPGHGTVVRSVGEFKASQRPSSSR